MKTDENDIEQQLMEAERSATAHRPADPSPTRPELEEDEIDLADLLRQIWARRRVVWITTLVVFLIGVFVATVSPEEYEASVVLMPQSSEVSSGVGSGFLQQFSGLAGLGLGRAGGNGTLSPALYPEVTKSTPFFLAILEKEIYFSALDTTVTFSQYFGEFDRPGLLDHVKRYTIGLPQIILNLPVRLINAFDNTQPTLVKPDYEITNEADTTTSRPLILTGRQLGVIGKLKGRIQTSIEANNTVKISAEMPDPMVAAETTELAADYLTNYILEYRTEKAQQDLAFVQKQYDEKKQRFNAIQRELARFRDRNLNIISETARIEQDRLETENQLASSLYQSLAQQLEQAKVKVQEETPVFKVLEPIQVPLGKSKPNRELIIALSLFVGVFLGLGIIFGQILYRNLKKSLAT